MSLHPIDEWRAVPGFPDYDVTADGRVRSWRKRGGKGRRVTARAMSGTVNGSGYRSFHLRFGESLARPKGAHTLVMAAFVGPRPSGMDIRHLNGDPLDNRLENLAYGTRSENIKDQVNHGTHANARKTECKNGHPFDDENTLLRPSSPGRRCLTCIKAARRLSRPLKPKEIGPRNIGHGRQSSYVRGCRCDECRGAQRAYMTQWRARQAEAGAA